MGDNKFNIKVEGLNELPPPEYSAVAVAISGSGKSKNVIKWALEKFVPEGLVHFKLLHIRPVISRIPTPMGNYVLISQVRDDVASAFRKEVQSQVAEKLLPYKKLCDQRKVHLEIVQIESNDVVTAISANIHKNRINRLVIGSSSRSIFSRSSRTLSSKISESCPNFCTVYIISKGKLSSLRPSDSEANISFTDDSSQATYSSTDNSSSHTSSSRTDQDSFAQFRSASLPLQRFQALSTINQTLHKKMPSTVITHQRNLTLDNTADNGTDVINYHTASKNFSFTSSTADNPSSDRASTPDTPTKNQADINFELEKVRIELRHIRGMYAMAQTEAIDASRKLSELQKRREQEETNFRQISFKEEEAKELAIHEKKRYEDAKREADYVKECAVREAEERREAEIRAARETKEKENLDNVLNGNLNHYRKFTWEEILHATSSFSDDRKIGMGAYGTVYRSTFHHTTAAVKILHAKEASRNKQFQQELDILSQIRHPHLLILIGACPEHSCIVYEFMENGSLEDRLMRKTNNNNNTPLLWFDRFRIVWEVASALVFLHSSSIIHRDLKPANILLDHNNVSKIGDVGLSTVVNKDSLSVSAPVGTLCYIDPEYQRTGVVAPESDVYAFGMVILQLLTAKPAIALTHKVEMAVANDRLTELFDEKGGDWPIEETKELALIALKCTELRRIDRPEMKDEVLPVLEKLKDFAENARILALNSPPPPPKQFICPISNVVMTDPCVAGDGYTYDREAIEGWLREKDTSPVTELRLPHKYLIPNYTLLSAIMEWKS